MTYVIHNVQLRTVIDHNIPTSQQPRRNQETPAARTPVQIFDLRRYFKNSRRRRFADIF